MQNVNNNQYYYILLHFQFLFFIQAEDGIRARTVTGVQTCALPIANTGGMGAYAPLGWAPPGLATEVLAGVIQPAIDEMRRRGSPYRGLLYAGLSLTAGGVRVIEFNARFGDPESQVVLDRLASPLAGLLAAAAAGSLA